MALKLRRSHFCGYRNPAERSLQEFDYMVTNGRLDAQELSGMVRHR